MVEVKFHAYPDGRLGMTVGGHAGFGEKGQDIVCAAVSILTLTAAETAQQLYLRGCLMQMPETVLEEGFARVQLWPKPRFRQQARQTLETVRTGMGLLARSHPRHVRVKGRI